MVAPRLVGVTARVIDGARGQVYGVITDYVDAIARAGAVPVMLLPRELGADDAHALLDRLDGFVFPGGPDVDPARYGESPHERVYGIDTVVDAFEFALMRAVIERQTPALAICRGLQVLNVALGGTLHQHITDDPTLDLHGVPGKGGHPVLHEVAMVDGSTIVASSHHHQAVKALAPGLRVTGHTPDGVVEAVTLDGAPNLVAVQWHPEETAATDPANQALFAHLGSPVVPAP